MQRGVTWARAGRATIRTVDNRRRSPPPPLWTPPLQTKVTVVGKDQICNRDNLIGPVLVHKALGSQIPPPPLPPPSSFLLMSAWGSGHFRFRCPCPSSRPLPPGLAFAMPAPLPQDYYHQRLKPLMADWALLWLQQEDLPDLSDADCLEFLMHRPAPDSALGQRLGASEATPALGLLNFAHDWVQYFMPHILQKIDRVTFGIMTPADYARALQLEPNMPATRHKLAIPFVGKDVPSRASEYAHPDIAIGSTILAYRYEGLRMSDLEDIIAALQDALAKVWRRAHPPSVAGLGGGGVAWALA